MGKHDFVSWVLVLGKKSVYSGKRVVGRKSWLGKAMHHGSWWSAVGWLD